MAEGKTQDWSSFPAQSEVWIYQADRELNDIEITEISASGLNFVDQWNTHGKALTAGIQIKYKRFIIVVADPNNTPSGCSKDSMVHFIQSVGGKYAIDFFNRMQVLYRTETGELTECLLQDLSTLGLEGAINEQTIVFNNLVNTKSSFDDNWETRLGNSWHKQFLN